jgi:WD40 repeat protein
MARLQLNAMSRLLWLLAASYLAAFCDHVAAQTLYKQPVLVLDEGRHSASIRSASVANDRFVTGSEDKTVRVWSLQQGKLLRTIRVPEGPENIGKIYSVALSPNGRIVAAGGWTSANGEPDCIYLFDADEGNILTRITGLDDVVTKLVFSSNGRYLAAGLGSKGLRVYEFADLGGWREAFRDLHFDDSIYGMSFSPDDRLAAVSFDGQIKLYDADFKLAAAPKIATSGGQPFEISFNPNGNVLALGYSDTTAVDLLDGHNLQSLAGPNVEALSGITPRVAWSKDGRTLFAGAGSNVVQWADAGLGERRELLSASDTMMSINILPDDAILITAADLIRCLNPDATVRWEVGTTMSDLRSNLAVSADGAIIDFGYGADGKYLLRYNVETQELTHNPPADHTTAPPKIDGLSIQRWKDEFSPILSGGPIALDQHERSRSLAIDPQAERFVLGTSWALRAIDAQNKRLWKRDTPGAVRAVNVTGDGRLVVAQFDDGTIRWLRMDSGIELLTLMVLPDKKNWVAWTPEGYFASTSDARSVLQWYINDRHDAFNSIGKTVPVSAIQQLYRPDVLPLVLRHMDIVKALGVADITADRFAIQDYTGAATPPGIRLHVLTIGIDTYGEYAKSLHLDFAKKDSEDVANALKAQASNSGKVGSLYASTIVQNLANEAADKGTIFETFKVVKQNVALDSSGHDLVVVMFAGHGALINDQFYLLPYGVDARTPARIEGTAISAIDFQKLVASLAQNHQVLVLLDACHSGAIAGDGTQLTTNADKLLSALDLGNVAVLTSSRGDQPSRENASWQHGAFTKVLLAALAGTTTDIETDHGVISVFALAKYLKKNLPALAGPEQQLGMSLKFDHDIFVAGM